MRLLLSIFVILPFRIWSTLVGSIHSPEISSWFYCIRFPRSLGPLNFSRFHFAARGIVLYFVRCFQTGNGRKEVCHEQGALPWRSSKDSLVYFSP
ncbi:hypothetical protein CEXT_607531 [Caerostris extrusa]|uniref:Secreted protein n=1 Tax=Caerostris extrusa TaxID=172846 RepID=A0AAV4VNG4_CAEEX|nr:hypothetical protein CEXT_607531 [Caerostris extrusa]